MRSTVLASEQPAPKTVPGSSLVPAASLRALRCTDDVVRSLLRGTRTQMRLPLDMARLRVRLPGAVHSDMGVGSWALDPLKADAGLHRAAMNAYGAVSAHVGQTKLGLRPGEFRFVSPYAVGDTILGLYGRDDKRWTIIPRGVNLLWVQEAFAVVPWLAGADRRDPDDSGTRRAGGTGIRYRATWTKTHSGKWASSSRMAQRLSRITLQIESVRIERLQLLTEEDARAEGVERREHSARLWDDAHGEGSFDSNPWVSALTFQTHVSPVDGAAR